MTHHKKRLLLLIASIIVATPLLTVIILWINDPLEVFPNLDSHPPLSYFRTHGGYILATLLLAVAESVLLYNILKPSA